MFYVSSKPDICELWIAVGLRILNHYYQGNEEGSPGQHFTSYLSFVVLSQGYCSGTGWVCRVRLEANVGSAAVIVP